MGVIHDALTYGLTIRESATDGSDFTNPTADYRRLFLGEDGQLHVKDSAGTVTDIGASSGSVATDAIWDAAGDLAVGTGANTAARMAIGAAGGYVSRVNGAVVWNSGTSMPTAATGDRYWRTDLPAEAYYDGTRWLSQQVFRADAGPGDVGQNGTANGVIGRGVFDGTQECYLLKAVLFAYVQTTNTGSAYWTFDVRKQDSSVGGTSLGSANTSADAASTGLTKTITINAVLTSATYLFWDINATKTGSPGAFRAGGSIFYRRVYT